MNDRHSRTARMTVMIEFKATGDYATFLVMFDVAILPRIIRHKADLYIISDTNVNTACFRTLEALALKTMAVN
jgi:hypothetical protein